MDIFKIHDLKKTKSREIIYNKLKELNEPISSDELHKMISGVRNINLATIYRNLNTFVGLGIMDKIVRQDGIAYYFLNNEHSHYMVCDKCKNQFKLENCPIDMNYINLLNKSGFKATGHTLEIHGICRECQNENIDEND